MRITPANAMKFPLGVSNNQEGYYPRTFFSPMGELVYGEKELLKMCEQGKVYEYELYRQLDQVIDAYRGQPGGLIQVLHKAQQLFGYLPEEAQRKVADGLNVSLNEVYGVATFYSFFSLKPRGKHRICVCQGTACYVRGSNRVLDGIKNELEIEAGDVTADRNFSLEVVRCLGACGLGPVMTVDEEVHARLKADGLPAILRRYQ